MPIHVLDLNDGRRHDPRPVLAGGWKYLQLLHVPPGGTETLPDGDVEYACFVVDGDGTAVTGPGTYELRRGASLVLLRGASAELRAGDAGLEVYVEAVDAPLRTPPGEEA